MIFPTHQPTRRGPPAVTPYSNPIFTANSRLEIYTQVLYQCPVVQGCIAGPITPLQHYFSTCSQILNHMYLPQQPDHTAERSGTAPTTEAPAERHHTCSTALLPKLSSKINSAWTSLSAPYRPTYQTDNINTAHLRGYFLTSRGTRGGNN